MRISARADYAIRAALELTTASDSAPVKGQRIAEAQDISQGFLEDILRALRNHGLVETRRGYNGGYWLARPSEEITIGEVMRAVGEPPPSVRGEHEYRGTARPLHEVWVTLRNNVRGILDNVTLADVIADRIPTGVKELGKKPDLRAY